MMVLWNTLDYSLVDLLPFLFVRAAKVNGIFHSLRVSAEELTTAY